MAATSERPRPEAKSEPTESKTLESSTLPANQIPPNWREEVENYLTEESLQRQRAVTNRVRDR